MPKKALATFFVVVVILGIAIAAYYFTKDSREIAYHRKQYRALSENYATNYSTIIADESQRMAYISRWDQHKKALLELGYLVERDFRLERPFVSADTYQELRMAISNAPFISKESSYSLSSTTNSLHVWAYRGDIPTWEKVVFEFNARGTNQ